MAKQSFIPKNTWRSRHSSFTQKIEGFYDFDEYGPDEGIETYRKVSKEFQRIIADAVKNQQTLRAMGSSWSLSKVGVTNHRLISSKNLKINFSLSSKSTSSAYTGDRVKLRFFECGYTLGEINLELLKKGLSLKASGSNNGQTLPGAVSTNTHGAAYKFGATPEFVVGIHLITGPTSQVYLERKSYPVVTKKFAEKTLGATFIRDDALFNAALVSFGSCGIIRGMMIETRELFLLHLSRKFRDFDKKLEKAMTTLTFSDFTPYFKELEKAASERNGFPVTFNSKNLYHFQVTCSPNQAEKGKRPRKAAVFFGFEGKYRVDYTPPPKDEGGIGPGASGLELVGALFELTPGPLKKFVKSQLNKQVEKLFQYEYTGTFQELFRGEKTRGKVFASGIGLPLSRCLDAMDIALRTYEAFGIIMPVLFTIRYVKGTKATLGFTKFKPTCILEIDGLNTANMQEYANQVWDNMEKAGIPFTMHWGKFNSHLTPDRIKKMYGANAQEWIDSRKELLKNPKVRQVFTNDFLKRVGLAT